MIGEPFLERALEGSRKHAARRVDEMDAARDLLVELGVEPRVAAASAAQLASELAARERRVEPMTTQHAVGTRRASGRARSCRAGTTSTSTSLRTCPSEGSTTARSRAASRSSGSRASPSSRTTRRPPSARRSSRRSSPRCEVLGTLTLNWAVGGMNALAVEIAAREGARIVWMPTVDSPAETAGRTRAEGGRQGSPVGATPARASEPRAERRRRATSPTPAASSCPRRATCCAAIARHDLILATGHLARDDTFAVVDGCTRGRRRGHRRHASRVPVPELLARGPARACRRAAACSSDA